MLERLQAAMTALDELALALQDPAAIAMAQASNRDLVMWYVGLMQRLQPVAVVNPSANGRPKSPAASGS